MTLICPFWIRTAAGQATGSSLLRALSDTIPWKTSIPLEQPWDPLGQLSTSEGGGDLVYISIPTHCKGQTASPGPRPTVKPVHNLHTGKRLVAMAMPKHILPVSLCLCIVGSIC